MKTAFIQGSKIPVEMIKSVVLNPSVISNSDMFGSSFVTIRPVSLQIHFGNFGNNSNARGIEEAVKVIANNRNSVSIPVMNIKGYDVLTVIDELAIAGFYNKFEYEALQEKVNEDLNKIQNLFDILIKEGYGIESYLSFKQNFSSSEIRLSTKEDIIKKHKEYLKMLKNNNEIANIQNSKLTFNF